MIVKSEVKLIDGVYVFALDISVNKFLDEPWNNLGKRVSFSIDSSEDMEMFEKHAKIWGWKLPAKRDTKKRPRESKKSQNPRRAAKMKRMQLKEKT